MDFQKSISAEDCIIQTVASISGNWLECPRHCDLNLEERKRPLILSQHHSSEEKASGRPGLWGDLRLGPGCDAELNCTI